MKAIIFGITGQDGSYLAELLLEKGYEVIGVTRRVSVPTLNRITHILPKIKIIEGDITDAFSVSNVIKEEAPDEIYNLAAQSHVGTSFKQPSLTWDVTAGGVLNILEAIRYSGRKDDIKFYQASSSEMFGKNYNLREGLAEMIKYQDEKTPFMPQSPYAIAKLAAHHLVRNYRDSYGIFACSGILFNHESERRGEKFVTRKITKWIGEFVASGMDTEFPALRLGNLDAKRDWGHAEDYVRGMWEMVQHETPNDYVVATGETHSVRDFVQRAFGHADVPGLWSGEGMNEKFRVFQENTVLAEINEKFYRPAEVDLLHGDSTPAREELGWKPEISFDKLVESMVDNDLAICRKEKS